MIDITDDAKKVTIILTHKSTKYSHNLLSPFAPTSPSLDDLKTSLIALFNPPEMLVKSLAEFQDRVKQISQSYSQYFKDLNRLTELCRFGHKSKFLKYKIS